MIWYKRVDKGLRRMIDLKNKEKNDDNFKLLIRRIGLLILDSLLIIAASYFSLVVRFEFGELEMDPYYMENLYLILPMEVILTLLTFWFFRIYHSLWEYISEREIFNLIGASGVSSLLQLLIVTMMGKGMPRSYYILYWVFIACAMTVTRAAYRYIRIQRYNFQKAKSNKKTERVMVLGAGEAGTALIREIQTSEHLNYKVCCVMDIDKNKHGKFLRGVPIVGDRNNIVRCAEKYKIDKIFIALPKLGGKELKPILDICNQTECEVRKVAGIYQLVNGEVSVSQLKKVEIEDLLGRDPVQMDLDKILGYVEDRVVMVTGGSGSIGSEICRQIASKNPKKLVILDVYENTTYVLQRELMKKHPELNLSVEIASVRDENRLQDIFETHHPEIIYHAAAYKHVPLMEACPNEAIKNNVLGTYNVVKTADKYSVKKFIQISTDKAVNPTNIMGASKRICEMIIQSYNRRSETEYVAVRFGNVLGSNGSVIPLFRKQIEEGGPITVTHPEIIRYFMTIPEAVSLVLMAGAYAKGGEIFVLDMGEPVRILDLARNMIRLAGLKEGQDIDIVFTGLRPGEKLYEELLMDEEGMKPTENSLIYIGKPIEIDEEKLYKELERMRKEAGRETADMRTIVKEIVPTYILPDELEKMQNS